ncbi:alpha/beta hydrolase [Paraburkholderia sp. A3BS-1L]|uniref:alpha/beta hydrolase n=1 Tax=unclassified Paraburkholderia TaxID=2615204 RepID=UPI003B7AC2B2
MNEPRARVLPGYLNSGSGRGHTRWEAAHAGFERVRMPDRMHPDCNAWCRTLEVTLNADPAGESCVLLAAHSFGWLMSMRKGGAA